MFEVGFSELVMVAIVALIVIGPEQLPRAARGAGLWLGRIRSTVAALQAEINQQLHAEQLGQLLQPPEQPLKSSLADSEAALIEINAALDLFAEPPQAPAEPANRQQ